MQKLFSRSAGILGLSILLIPSLQPVAHAQDAVVSYQSAGAYNQSPAVSFQTFYDQLAPYGQWVNDPQYGNVWVPNEEPGYRPYATRGRWVMTDQGNMWVSDVPWGWACYHYGRWTYNGYYGWVWIPGYEWAPAWVNWRSGGGYYGWAPMGPGQYPGSYYEYPVNYWVFVSPGYLYQPNVYGYYEPRYAERYYRNTTYINETYAGGGGTAYYYGPRAEVIERETHQPVQVYRVSSSNQPGAATMGGNGISIYRPAVNRESVNTARPANVIRSTQPIGKPEAISADYAQNRPAFHQEIQKQNPAFKAPNNYSNNNNNATRGNEGNPQNNQFNHNQPEGRPQANPMTNHPAQQAQPAPKAAPINNQMNRAEPQNNNVNRAEPQNNSENHNPEPAQHQQNTQPQQQQPKQGGQPKQKHSAPPKEKKK